MPFVPDVSVIIPAYGVADLVGEALRSLQAQTFPAWEAIVIDDGDPRVAPALAAFVDDARIRLIRTSNGGPSVARNRAAAAARAPLIALLDGDDAYEPHYLETMVGALSADPAIGFVTCDATYVGLADRRGRRFSDFYAQRGTVSLSSVLSRDFNIFVACTIRRVAFEAVGGFDEELAGAEDLALWIALLATGWCAKAVSEPLVRYCRRAASLSSNTDVVLAAEERLYRKLVPALVGRAEQADAIAMLGRVEGRRSHIEGERLILLGRVREGMALIRAAGKPSGYWRIAVPLMRTMPWIARPILRLRASHLAVASRS